MKRFLCAWERYVLLEMQIFRRGFFSYSIIQILAIILFFLFYSKNFSQAQESVNPINSVRVGEQMPDNFWYKKYQYYDFNKLSTIDISKFKDKHIIIAFWSAGCGSCINSFPFLNELNSKFSNNLLIIPVNSYDNNIEKIDKVFSRFDEKYQIPGIVFDKEIKALFPHTSVPHYVWISPKGQVRAITVKSFMTLENIKKFIEK